MADTPEATVRAVYELFSKGQIDQMLKTYFTEDIEWFSVGDKEKLPWYAVDIKGRDAVKSYFDTMLTEIEIKDLLPHTLIVEDKSQAGSSGRHIVGLADSKVILKKNKKECVHPVCHVWLLTEDSGGKWRAKSFRHYADSAQIVRLAEEA